MAVMTTEDPYRVDTESMRYYSPHWLLYIVSYPLQAYMYVRTYASLCVIFIYIWQIVVILIVILGASAPDQVSKTETRARGTEVPFVSPNSSK